MSAFQRFLLLRHRDPTGVSGTGVVAEGAQFSDGSAALRWHGQYPATSVFEAGAEAIGAIHGHDGATEIVYGDPANEYTRRTWNLTNRPADTHNGDDLCSTCGGAWPCTHCHPHAP